MSRLCTLAALTLLLLASALPAAPPAWVDSATALLPTGPVEREHRVLLRYRRYELDRSGQTTFRQRELLRIGGANGVGDLEYPMYHSADDRFTVVGGWQIARDGKITALSRKLLKRNQIFPDFMLYADEYYSVWGLNNLEAGSLVALEFERVTPLRLEQGFVYLQDDDVRVDSTMVEFVIPAGSRLVISPHGANAGSRRIEGTRVGAAHLAKWKAVPLCGGFRVSATGFHYALYPDSGDRPPQTWPDVAGQVAAKWQALKWTVDRAAMVHEAITDKAALERFLREYEHGFRYVAVETGDGRIPHEPRHVLAMKYGDCKDLSLLLAAVLTAPGVTVVPVLVSTPASKPFAAGFPCDYAFNHCIVAMVLGADTLYYDPTARDYPLGVLPWQEQGAPALWVQPGAELIELPRDSHPFVSKQRLQGRLDLRGDFAGSVMAEYDPRTSGEDWQDVSADERRQTIRGLFRDDLNLDVGRVSLDVERRLIEADVVIRNYARSTGEQLYWKPYPFAIDFPDSVRHDLPEGYYTGPPCRQSDQLDIALPAECRLPDSLKRAVETLAGTVSLEIAADASRLRATWQREDRQWHYPASAVAAVDSFYAACRTDNNLLLRLPVRPVAGH